jgi:diguanylate cyclase (GGDEF)-like protein
MNLDAETLAVVTVFVIALLGALLVFAGLQNGRIRAPVWWGTAHIVNAAGLGFGLGFGLALSRAYGAAADAAASDMGNALILLGYGLMWSGARVFDGRKIRPLLVLLAPALWLALCRVPGFAANAELKFIAVSSLLAVLALRTAQELWRGRDEPLMSRWPCVVVLLAQAVVLFGRVPLSLLSLSFKNAELLQGLSLTVITFGTLLFTVILAFLQLNMTKERIELRHKINSLVDPLSGVANRRAFLDRASNLLLRHDAGHEPLAMLLFDLDHFKQINDRFGHATGDAVLRVFAGTATATLCADVLFARIGGEEFAACMQVGDMDEAYAIAERVRRNFAATAARFGNGQLSPTVSAGITLGRETGMTVGAMLSVADRALYRAKEHGRNRVETEMQAGGAPDAASGAPSIVPIIGTDRTASGTHPGGRRWRAAL